MRFSRRRILSVTGSLGVVGALAAGLLIGASPTSRRPAPPLPRAVLVPPAVTLASLGGHPTIIAFWASWCGPCHAEAPALARLARSATGRGKLVGIDYSDSLQGARAFIAQYGWTFPNLRDPDGSSGLRFGLIGLPTAYVLDPRGRITATLWGPQKEATLVEVLASTSGS